MVDGIVLSGKKITALDDRKGLRIWIYVVDVEPIVVLILENAIIIGDILLV